jgi:peroxiredoxin
MTPPSLESLPRDSRGGSQPIPETVLRNMAVYLSELPAFSCQIASTIEIKGPGIDRRIDKKMAIKVERPDRVSLVIHDDNQPVTFVSDGKQMLQYLPTVNRYHLQELATAGSALVAAAETAPIPLLSKTGVLVPNDGQAFYEALVDGVTETQYMGNEIVGGVSCHRFRFLSEDYPWDIWIESGDRPLIRQFSPDLSKRLASDAEWADAKFELTVSYTDWDVSPQFTETDFSTAPPAGAEKTDAPITSLGGLAEDSPHPLLGQPAPAFQTIDPDGEPIDLERHLGKNLVLLDFWATWCGPCVEAMPDVDAVADKYADRGLVFYSVNVGESAAAIKAFLTESKLDVPVAMDPDGRISGLYQVDGIPQTVLIGKDGRVQVVHIGFGSDLAQQLTQNIEDLLAGKNLAGNAISPTSDNETTSDGSAR